MICFGLGRNFFRRLLFIFRKGFSLEVDFWDLEGMLGYIFFIGFFCVWRLSLSGYGKGKLFLVSFFFLVLYEERLKCGLKRVLFIFFIVDW